MCDWLHVIGALGFVVAACSTDAKSTPAAAPPPINSCHGPGCGAATGGITSKADASSPVVGVAPAQDAGSAWSALCGPETGKCTPGSIDESCDQLAKAAEMSGDAGEADDSYPANDAGASTTCRIRWAAPGSTNIELSCETAGSATPGSACASSTDCSAGSTCVSDEVAPVCRHYCCEGPASCPSGTYCTNRNTYVRSTTNGKFEAGPSVPVCIPADNCKLSEPYPCPADQKCMCPVGKACMIVGAGGLTSCLEPIVRKSGDPSTCVGESGISLCDPGYVCSYLTYTCLKLCKLSTNKLPDTAPSTDPVSCPTGTTCEASNDVPNGWGVCSHQALVVN